MSAFSTVRAHVAQLNDAQVCIVMVWLGYAEIIIGWTSVCSTAAWAWAINPALGFAVFAAGWWSMSNRDESLLLTAAKEHVAIAAVSAFRSVKGMLTTKSTQKQFKAFA